MRDTNAYNCVGLVFAARRGHVNGDRGDGLIGPGAFAPYLHETVMQLLDDDSYSRLPEGLRPRAGDVVLYARASRVQHVALALGTVDLASGDDLVVSKFGDFGEYIHKLRDVPVDQVGNYLEIWSLGHD